jgi:hypothetical protein
VILVASATMKENNVQKAIEFLNQSLDNLIEGTDRAYGKIGYCQSSQKRF